MVDVMVSFGEVVECQVDFGEFDVDFGEFGVGLVGVFYVLQCVFCIVVGECEVVVVDVEERICVVDFFELVEEFVCLLCLVGLLIGVCQVGYDWYVYWMVFEIVMVEFDGFVGVIILQECDVEIVDCFVEVVVEQMCQFEIVCCFCEVIFYQSFCIQVVVVVCYCCQVFDWFEVFVGFGGIGQEVVCLEIVVDVEVGDDVIMVDDYIVLVVLVLVVFDFDVEWIEMVFVVQVDEEIDEGYVVVFFFESSVIGVVCWCQFVFEIDGVEDVVEDGIDLVVFFEVGFDVD